MLGSRFLGTSHTAKHGVVYNILEVRLRADDARYERTLGLAMRFHLATFAVALLMLVRHVLSVHDHAARLHPEPGQRLHVRDDDGSAGYLVRQHGEASPRDRGDSARASGSGQRRRVRDGRQSGVRVRADEAARRAAALGGPDHRRSAAEGGRGAESDDLHAEPAADPDQRPAHDKRIPAHAAEREPQRDL